MQGHAKFKQLKFSIWKKKILNLKIYQSMIELTNNLNKAI